MVKFPDRKSMVSWAKLNNWLSVMSVDFGIAFVLGKRGWLPFIDCRLRA
jgi:hypothetical protein